MIPVTPPKKKQFEYSRDGKVTNGIQSIPAKKIFQFKFKKQKHNNNNNKFTVERLEFVFLIVVVLLDGV